jgi:tRNA-dihydrouridine synthase 1
MPDRLLNDQDYLEYHIRDLALGDDELTRPVVVQLCGNNVETLVQAGRKVQAYCDGVGEQPYHPMPPISSNNNHSCEEK